MDLNNNYTPKTTESIKVSFQNEIEINMLPIPINDFKFDFSRFNRNNPRTFIAQPNQKIRTRNDSKRKSSLIDSQTKATSCLEQFTSLMKDKLDESGIENRFSRQLMIRLMDDLSDLDSDGRSEKSIKRFDQLTRPYCTEDLEQHLLDLVCITRSTLRICNKTTKKSTNNLIDCSNECDDLKSESMGRIELFHYLNTPDRVQVYRKRLDESIKKLNSDLVEELQNRETIYLQRDELFLQIDTLTKSCLQAIQSNSTNDNPEA